MINTVAREDELVRVFLFVFGQVLEVTDEGVRRMVLLLLRVFLRLTVLHFVGIVPTLLCYFGVQLQILLF